MPPIPTYSNLMGIWLEVGRRFASWAAWSAIRNQAGGPSFLRGAEPSAKNRRSIFLKRPVRSASAAGATCSSSVEWRPISCAIPLRSSRRDNTVTRSYGSALSMAGDIPHSPDARISRTTAVCSTSQRKNSPGAFMSRRVSFSNRSNVLSRGASGATLSSSIVRPRPNAVNSVPPASTQLFVSVAVKLHLCLLSCDDLAPFRASRNWGEGWT